MNYLIESSFLDDEAFGTVLWAEKMLATFVTSNDDKLGLNKCSAAEKKVIKVLCKTFYVDYVDHSSKIYLQKTPDARAPYLTIRDLLTQKKIEMYFEPFKSKFHDNLSSFPCKFMPYKSVAVEKEDFPRISQKPTNKEVSQHDMSLHSMHSRGSSLSSDSNKNISPHGLKKKRMADMMSSSDSNSKIASPRGDTTGGTDQKDQKNIKTDTTASEELVTTDEPQKTKQDQTSVITEENKPNPADSKENQEIEQVSTSDNKKENEKNVDNKQEESAPTHAIHMRDFERVQWTRKVTDDTSRLPSMYHILFAIIDPTEESFFVETIKEASQKVKVIKGLGGFAICESEAKAESLFHKLNKKLLVYPLKEVPRPIRNDQLRNEICFMEGVRPQKTTSVAERFIYKHLGFK